MANNPTTNKQLNRPDYNDQNWNVPLNSDFTILDQCLGNTLQPSQTSTNVYALTSTDIQNARINLTGTLTGTGTVTIPATYGGFWIVTNSTSGSNNLNVKVATGGNLVSVKNGYSTIVVSNGSECYDAVDQKLNITGGTITGNLAVNGSVNFYAGGGMSWNGSQLYANGTIYATGNITAFSDERLKHNVTTIDGALDLVNAMRGVRFEDKDGNKYVGLIAQELQPIVPEAVVEHDETKYLAVAYQNLVGVLVNAINELTERVKKLEEK